MILPGPRPKTVLMNAMNSAPGGISTEEIAAFLALDDNALLEAVARDEARATAFNPAANDGPAPTGLGFMESSRPVGGAPAAAWGFVLEVFTDLACKDLRATIERCVATPVCRRLAHPQSALRIAVLAWRCAQTREVPPGSLLEQLHQMEPANRDAALAAFGDDAAVSCAYEGIPIAPAQLSAAG